jgi:hypothetical protein
MNYVRACVISHDIRTKGPRLATVLLLMPFCFFFCWLLIQVLVRVKAYLQKLGTRIDSILSENEGAPNPDSKFIS